MTESNIDKKFVVIAFSEEQTVDAVPRTWLSSETNCKWPKKVTPAFSNLKKKADSAPQSDWLTYPCRVLGYFGTYEAALEAANRAELTSNLESEEEEASKSKKTRKDRNRKRRPSISSDSSASPASPLKKVSKEENTFHQNLQPPSSNLLISNDILYDPSSTLGITVPSSLTQSNAGPSLDVPQVIFEGDIKELEPNLIFLSSGNNIHSPSSASAVIPKSALGESNFQKLILRRLARIESNQDDILQTLKRFVGPKSSQEEELKDFSTLPEFPFTNFEALKQFNAALADEATFNQLISYLELIGGNSLEKLLKGILKRIFSAELAIQFSYTGKGKNNYSFLTFQKINQAILAAVRKHTKTATDENVRQIIMDWFRFSKPRKEKEHTLNNE